MAINFPNVPAIPLTQIDRAPKPATRTEPESVPTSKLASDAPTVERRRDPERRRRRKGQSPMDRRLGAERRRRSVDIEV